jgi:hypothetical protein
MPVGCSVPDTRPELTCKERKTLQKVIFVAIMAVNVKVTNLWNVPPRSLVDMYVFFFFASLYRHARLYDVTSQKTLMFILQRHSNDAISLKLLLSLRSRYLEHYIIRLYNFKPMCIIPHISEQHGYSQLQFRYHSSEFYSPSTGMFTALIVNIQHVRKCTNSVTILAHLLIVVQLSENC